MADLLHHAALYLLYARLAVYDHVVEVVGQHADDLLQVGVHAAVAALVLRAAYGEEGEAVRLHHGVKDAEARLVEHLYGLARAAVLRALYDGAAYIVERAGDGYAQRGGETHRRVGVYGKHAAAGAILRQHSHYRRGERGLPHPALAGERNYPGFAFIHTQPPFGLKSLERLTKA